MHHDDLYLDKEKIGKLMPATVITIHSCLAEHDTSKGTALGLLDQYSTYLSLITLGKVLIPLENHWPFYLLEANH